MILRIVFILLASELLIACSAGSTSNDQKKPKNVILFIGDGMGAEHRKAARMSKVGANGELSMDLYISGSLITYSADNEITDSAAASTAMATGVKTNNGVIGLDANLNKVTNLLEDAKAQGKSVGLVTTTHITHATPASFAAHIEDRYLMSKIAAQMLTAGVDVLLGGGEDEFLPADENGCFPEGGERSDGRSLIDEAVAIGYSYVCDNTAFELIEPASTGKLLGLFADEGMQRPFSPTLASMTKKAIDILSRNPDGFFLMVEGGQIDWASHNNDAENVISDTIGLDDSVAIARQFTSVTNDTLIIVTADHETGGMVVTNMSSGEQDEDGPFSTSDGSTFYVNWRTTGHTSANVPVTSQGSHSNLLNGDQENTYIHEVITGTF